MKRDHSDYDEAREHLEACRDVLKTQEEAVRVAKMAVVEAGSNVKTIKGKIENDIERMDEAQRNISDWQRKLELAKNSAEENARLLKSEEEDLVKRRPKQMAMTEICTDASGITVPPRPTSRNFTVMKRKELR